MGSKRFFEDGLFQEFTSKHPRLVNATESYPCIELPRKAYIPVESDGFYLEDENKNIVSPLTDKEVEISAPYSWVTSCSSEEDGGLGASASSLSVEYPEFHFPSKSNIQPEETNTYSSSIYGTPAIPIPLGPDHQAELPLWNPLSVKKYSFGYEQLMGDRVIPAPSQNLSSQIEIRAGNGRKRCKCLNRDSSTCVNQHVREARERLRADIGPEKFVKLGFCDMGEDVSQLWTEEEERVFHEVVYSNSVSHNKNFWDHLSATFPSRAKKEIVSYYFNVFILRRRSVQNRSNFLDIDSDDDEWNVSYWEPVESAQEDDCANDSPNIDEVDYEDDLPDDSPIIDEVYEEPSPVVYEHQNNQGDCKDGAPDDHARSSVDGFDSSYLMEPSHGKVWDDTFQLSPFRFNEFISTGQMIEELFGGSPDSGSMF